MLSTILLKLKAKEIYGYVKMPKKAQTTALLHSSHTLAKYCSKFSQVRLQQYVNRELPDMQAGFRKGRGTRD